MLYYFGKDRRWWPCPAEPPCSQRNEQWGHALLTMAGIWWACGTAILPAYYKASRRSEVDVRSRL